VKNFYQNRLIIFSIQGLCSLLLLLTVTGPLRAEGIPDDFSRCLADLHAAALDEGVSADIFRQATAGLTPDMRTVVSGAPGHGRPYPHRTIKTGRAARIVGRH